MQARRRCVLLGYRAELGYLRNTWAVTKYTYSRTVLEKLTAEGESPIGEMRMSVIQFLSKPKHVEFRLN